MTQTLLDGGRDAAARGDWREAHELLVAADAQRALVGTDLALLAGVAYAAGHLDLTIETWERAHAEGLRAGDPVAAATAATRVAMHLLFDTALLAPVRAWIRRAERLLENLDEAPVHAWLAVVRNYERLLSGDFTAAREWARRAIDVGSRHDPAAAALGRIAEARSLILDGEVRHGLELLEDAAVATVSGELDPFTTGVVYCELVCALQALGHYDLAEEWTQAMERWRHGHATGSIHGRCRVHRAEILRLRGSTGEAEQEALRACEELRPYLRRELGWPLTELGRIRFRKGDLDGAEKAYLAAHQAGWDPQPGLALLHLARGDAALAAASIQDALEHPLRIPSKELPPNTELRRAPLLDAQVEIAVAAGDLECARRAAEELDDITATFQTKALAAAAAGARARVRLAEGDATGALGDFEAALRLWSEVGAPYETAVARMGVAQAHRARGNEQRALLEFRAARATFERIGAAGQAQRAAEACADARTEDPRPGAESNVFTREGDHWRLTFDRHTVRLRDLKGLHYLARLLGDPGRDRHVLELVALERDGAPAAAHSLEPGLALSIQSDAGEMLDERAKLAYRRRLAEIEEDLVEARQSGDVDRESQADDERDFLMRELARAVGLGGRDRRAASDAERARASVTRAVRSAIARIREHHASLAEHLDSHIRTGVYCAYRTDPRGSVTWTV